MSSATDTGAGCRRQCLHHLAVLGFFLVVALVMTWPLVANLTSHVPSGAHDIWQNYWNLWWWKTAVWENHQSPYVTDRLFHPETTRLGNHTHSPANMLWTLPVNVLFGVPAALNLAVLAGFVFAGYGAYLLATLYTRRDGPAILAGVAFAYLPQHVEQALEHLNLASYQALPFFLWALVRGVRDGGLWWFWNGALFALNALFSWHNALLSIPLGVGAVVYEAWRGPRPLRSVLLDLTKAAALATLIVLPFLWPVVRDTRDGVAVLQKAPRRDKPIYPPFLLVPHQGHPIWGAAVDEVYRVRGYPSVGFVSYLGVVNLALAATALALGRRKRDRESVAPRPQPVRSGVLLWTALAAFFLLCSCGESLRLTRDYEIPWLRLPFYWLKEVPLFGLVRVPNRFLVPAALAVSVLAAIGADAIASRLAPTARRAALALLVALLLVDLAWLPFPVRPVPRPDWLAALAEQPAGLAVLDIPSGHRARAAEDMLYQTFHGRPIASGYVATKLASVESTLETFPVLRRVFERYPPESAFSGPTLVEAIRHLDVGLVVVHLDRTVESLRQRAETVPEGDFYAARLHDPERGIESAALNRFRIELREAFGAPVHEDGVVEIYRVR